MKRQFETEADIRNYRSKMLLLPKKLLLEINQMIDEGKREWAVEGFIRKNYKGSLGVPTAPTIGVYIDWYEARKKIQPNIALTQTSLSIIENAEVIDIDREHQAILDKDTDITNKQELLERLIKKCIQRMKSIENVQEVEGVTASLEAVVGHYLREVHSLVQTQLKLSGELQEETNDHISKLIGENLYLIIQVMFRVLQKITPDKVEEIKKEFFEEIQANKQLVDTLNIKSK